MRRISKPKYCTCAKTSCMKNIGGKCCHSTCPLKSKRYKMPQAVAEQIEQEALKRKRKR